MGFNSGFKGLKVKTRGRYGDTRSYSINICHKQIPRKGQISVVVEGGLFRF